jgi:polyphosphate kinase
MRLDEFYGVAGTAVKATLDQIIALKRVDKATDKEKLKKLYTSVKQFAMHCRLNQNESELMSAFNDLHHRGKDDK